MDDDRRKYTVTSRPGTAHMNQKLVDRDVVGPALDSGRLMVGMNEVVVCEIRASGKCTTEKRRDGRGPPPAEAAIPVSGDASTTPRGRWADSKYTR